MNFQQKLDAIITNNNSLLCIGLDPVLEKIPEHLRNEEFSLFQFNKAIIDATHDVVCGYKPNSAFYEAYGAKGVEQLKMTCDYLNETYPEIPIILDAKRADIGSTNEGYAKFAFNYLNVDGITLQCYFGGESLRPFIEYEDKASIVMCKNSNPDSGEFQDLMIDGQPLYKVVAENFTRKWNYNRNIMLVVGATHPAELADVRNIVGDMTLLVPGVGAQGGDIEKTVKAGINSRHAGIIISSSRTIIYAGSGEDFAVKAKQEAVLLKDEINTYRF